MGQAVALTSWQVSHHGGPLTQRPHRLRSIASQQLHKPLPTPEDRTSIVARPDGYYWVATESHQEFGPFESYEAADADRSAFSDAAWEPGETLREAESEIGIANWVDPLTGELAQGQSAPHIEED